MWSKMLSILNVEWTNMKFDSSKIPKAAIYSIGAAASLVTTYYGIKSYLTAKYAKNLLVDGVTDAADLPSRSEHDRKRTATYPNIITNTWYHLYDAKDLQADKPVEVRALNRDFVLWRDANGKPVCQSAFCLHLGANLAVGGKIVNGCIECPFHRWKFNSEGAVTEIPYIKDPTQVPKQKLKT